MEQQRMDVEGGWASFRHSNRRIIDGFSQGIRQKISPSRLRSIWLCVTDAAGDSSCLLIKKKASETNKLDVCQTQYLNSYDMTKDIPDPNLL